MKGMLGDHAAAAMEDADKEKKKRRRQNRRPKQYIVALPGGGCSSLKTTSPEKVSDVAFSSLPPIHIGDAEPSRPVVEGEISRSCPLPTSNSSPFETPSSSDNWGLLPNPNKRKFFAPHWSDQAVEEAIEKGNAFKATFRVNAHNRLEAYCTIDGVPVDVLINGVAAQNRAVEGDTVALMLDPVAYWTKLKGSNVPTNPVLADDSDIPPEVREAVGKNSTGRDHMDANGLLYEDNGYCESKNTSESVHFCHENGYGSRDNKSAGHQYINNENSKAGCSSEQREAGRALGRIRAMINSCPQKRPTGKVLAIIKKSPRRRAVIGFLAAKQFIAERDGNWKQTSGRVSKKDENNISLSDDEFIQLLPTDSKFPKMVVCVSHLPDSVKERINSGDATIQGELIAAQIDDWSDESLLPQACVIDIFGRGGEIEPQIAAIMFENTIRAANFSPESLNCLPDLPWEIPRQEFEIRKDLRNICTFTVDPPAAIDLDDALSVEIISDEIFRIGVHIADVSYFVLPDTALDTEAQIRSTSVYILQHKLPMLPPEFSEGLCSLLPGVDRLAFSVTWDINHSGKIIDRWIGRSVIHSCCKLSYDLVQDIIGGSVEADQFNSLGSVGPQLHGQFEWKDVIKSLRSLYEISTNLRENRFKDGALSLESSKLGFLFDECGTPYESFLHERKESCSLVEEFMLLANRSVAEVISMAFPDCALLRRHPEPNLRKLRDFEAFCSKHGFELDTSSSGQLHLSLSKIREKLKDDPLLFDILVSYASRPMQSATYFCTGDLRDRATEWAHYALSVPFYTHFTSPLRRYPDIIVHRTLSAVLDAEEMYLKQRQIVPYTNNGEAAGTEVVTKCFTGLHFNKAAAESEEGGEALAAAALKFKVPGPEVLAEAAAYCNERKFASRHAEEAGEKLYLWTLLRKKEIFVSEARVLALGPRFMSVYIRKLAIERRIYYDDVEGMIVDWLETTSTLVLDLHWSKRFQRRGCSWKFRAKEDVAIMLNPSEDEETETALNSEGKEISPAVFPLVLRHLSTVPVALHAVGGDDGPLEIGARLYMCSYFR